jgi:hypothetical protein
MKPTSTDLGWKAIASSTNIARLGAALAVKLN